VRKKKEGRRFLLEGQRGNGGGVLRILHQAFFIDSIPHTDRAVASACSKCAYER
jgi:hypothetical protein